MVDSGIVTLSRRVERTERLEVTITKGYFRELMRYVLPTSNQIGRFLIFGYNYPA
jgi:hypothetical protein